MQVKKRKRPVATNIYLDSENNRAGLKRISVISFRIEEWNQESNIRTIGEYRMLIY